MFAKLLKYDFRATWGLIGGLSIIALGAGVSRRIRGLLVSMETPKPKASINSRAWRVTSSVLSKGL